MFRCFNLSLFVFGVVLALPAWAGQLPVRAFAQLERNSDIQLSPDGTKIATLSNINGRFGISIRSLTNTQAQPVVINAPAGKLELRWIKWANNDYLLAGLGTYYKRFEYIDSHRETRLLSIKADGGKILNPVVAGKEKQVGSMVAKASDFLTAVVQDDVIDFTPEDPKTILLSIYEDSRYNTSASVRKIDVATGQFDRIMTRRRDVSRYDTDANAEVRLAWGQTLAAGVVQPFMEYRVKDGGWVTRRNSRLLESDFALSGFFKDPRYAYVLAPVNGRRALVKWDMENDAQAEVILADAQRDIEYVAWDENSRTPRFAKLSDDSDVYLDAVWEKRLKALHRAIPGMTLEVISATPASDKFIIRATSPQEPGIYYLFDSARKSLEVLEYAYAGIGPENLAPREFVTYTTRDGLKLEAVLTRPRDALPKSALPTVILPHGGPWSHDRLEFDWLAQFLADRGYLVLQPNFRGSDGYGKALLDAGDGQWGLAMQDDLTDGLKFLVGKGDTDPKRVCILGGSYGGYAALWGAVKDPDLYRCAASFNGVSDIVALLRNDFGRFKDEESIRRIGDVDSERDKLEKVSPINFADKIKAPILLVHSRDDGRVDIGQSRRMAAKLQAAGKAVEFIEVEKGEHFLENEASRTTFLTALEAFLAKNLAP